MSADILQRVGQIAGIGGLALGVFLIVFREVVRKSIFPKLTKDHAFRLLRLIVVLTFAIALSGLAAWAYGQRTSEATVRSVASTVVDRCYRRAFALNYTTRFVDLDEYRRVERSMNECRGYVQSHMVDLQQSAPPAVRSAVLGLLGQLDSLDVLLSRTKSYAENPDFGDTNGTLPGRLDGTGQEELTRTFREMEGVRLNVLSSLHRIAALTETDLPPIPATLRDTVRFGRTPSPDSFPVQP